MPDGMNFRWLGAAGVELECGGELLLVDPYLSRVPFRYIFFGTPHPNRELGLRHLSPARAVLVTHPHFDHLMDVPTVCRELGATAYGSPNASALLLAHGISSSKIRIIHPGDNFQEGPFSVDVFSGEHNRIAGIIPHIGPLPKQLNPPLKLSDFRMDCMYSYRVSAGGESILLWNTLSPAGAPAADVLVITASHRPEAWRSVVAKVKPKAAIVIHWDDFFSPLEHPLRPMLAPPRLGEGLLRRMDPHEFAHSLETIFPEEKIYIPDIFQSVELKTIYQRV
jgi:L-ascorbate metabolism protein UlaG (beta-lactamase superfamily)